MNFTDLIPGQIYKGVHNNLTPGEYWIFKYNPYDDGACAWHKGLSMLKGSKNPFLNIVDKEHILSAATGTIWTFSYPSMEDRVLLEPITHYEIY